MASIIPGYEYDIFISYRQKDNKHDGWVTEFVNNLKGELEATFKEDVSIYFDENPHDRLQETHHVAKSLEAKLKCVIFIPILSQTYCDPGCYAWQFELVPFNKMAAEDHFGKEIKLRGGNYASRILPIRIHDLEPEDIELFQQETETALRAMDFVFKTASGVNRPLRAHEDHPKDNLNKTFYRDQVNKAANAIKEIILGMKAATDAVPEKKPPLGISLEKPIATGKWQETVKPARPAWPGIITGLAITVILILAGIYFFPKIFQQDRKEFYSAKGEISVAVMPFQNLTNDTTRNFWQVLVQDNLITALSNASELKVRQTESILALLDNNDLPSFASLTPSMARSVSQKLDANVFVHGSINQIGELTRLNAKLIDSETEEVFKSFQVDGTKEDILFLSDSLSSMIRNYLILDMLKKEFLPVYESLFEKVTSPEFFKFYLEGMNYFRKLDFPQARERLLKALEIDSSFIPALIYLSSAYGNQGLYEEAKKWSLKAYQYRHNASRRERLMLEANHANYFGTPEECIKHLRQRLDIDDEDPIVYYLIGLYFTRLNQFEQAIPALEKSLEIHLKWGGVILWPPNYTFLGYAYHKTGQYRKERRLYKKAEKDFPDDPAIISRQAILAMAQGKTKQAEEYLKKFESIIKSEGASEAIIQTRLGWIYEDAGMTDKAEEHLRKALLPEPENPWGINNLAYLLIEKDLNIKEGLELMEKVLELAPDNFYFLHTNGWGLYKQGKYQEALEVLQKSWDLRREQAVYYHEAYLHLEEAKKAVANL